MRYPFSGYNDDSMGTTSSATHSCINTKGEQKLGVTSGRVFWLRGLAVTNEDTSTGTVFELFDEAEAASPTTPTTGNQRVCVYVGPANTVVVDYPAPGILFQNGVCGTSSAGTVSLYSVQCFGYEE